MLGFRYSIALFRVIHNQEYHCCFYWKRHYLVIFHSCLGFGVFTLDSKDFTKLIPDLSSLSTQLARRLKGARALGIFFTNCTDFLLCYDSNPSQTKLKEECALFVDKHGEGCGPVLEWRDKPIAAVVIDGSFVVGFSTSSIEIWRIGLETSDGVSAPVVLTLVHIVRGHDIKMIGKHSTINYVDGRTYWDAVYVAMQSTKSAPRVLVEFNAESFQAYKG